MVDTERVHELVRSKESFEAFIAKVNDEGSFYEVFTATEGIGRETDLELDIETIDEIDHFMLGWMRLLWEAHQSKRELGYNDPGQPADQPGSLELLFFTQH